MARVFKFFEFFPQPRPDYYVWFPPRRAADSRTSTRAYHCIDVSRRIDHHIGTRSQSVQPFCGRSRIGSSSSCRPYRRPCRRCRLSWSYCWNRHCSWRHNRRRYPACRRHYSGTVHSEPWVVRCWSRTRRRLRRPTGLRWPRRRMLRCCWSCCWSCCCWWSSAMWRRCRCWCWKRAAAARTGAPTRRKVCCWPGVAAFFWASPYSTLSRVRPVRDCRRIHILICTSAALDSIRAPLCLCVLCFCCCLCCNWLIFEDSLLLDPVSRRRAYSAGPVKCYRTSITPRTRAHVLNSILNFNGKN